MQITAWAALFCLPLSHVNAEISAAARLDQVNTDFQTIPACTQVCIGHSFPDIKFPITGQEVTMMCAKMDANSATGFTNCVEASCTGKDHQFAQVVLDEFTESCQIITRSSRRR
ncbi:hypothetical protein BC830DRAFT_1124388 [Chytriomyces sp. MP71]|nr:hypothetical protein BC830DRAFT_1124388 [Chytriomyces sp. MP71]